VTLLVARPGPFTTVQDLGRTGWGASGVPPSGAVDEFSLRAANLLVGNAEDEAALEITIAGPELVFSHAHLAAFAGAPFPALLDGRPVVAGRSFAAAAGSTLSIGSAPSGVRCYLAVRGGFAVPSVLGSRSTFVPAGFGGFAGRPLARDDVLEVGGATGEIRPRALFAGSLPEIGRDVIVRVVPGPQEKAFTNRGVEGFFSTRFSISQRSDRAGVRLEGVPLELSTAADLDPEGVVTGAVQVPADGLPIILGPDRPATGGYVKIATVISADLPLVGQARPGDTLRFTGVSVEEAREARLRRLRTLRDGIEEPR
jgi:antagonist of KipI